MRLFAVPQEDLSKARAIRFGTISLQPNQRFVTGRTAAHDLLDDRKALTKAQHLPVAALI